MPVNPSVHLLQFVSLLKGSLYTAWLARAVEEPVHFDEPSRAMVGLYTEFRLQFRKIK